MSNRRRARSSDSEIEVSMTPMIDVTFQLLIFFIVTIQFRKLERELDSFLPTDRGPHAGELIEETVVDVAVRDAGGRVRLHYAGHEVDAADLGAACLIVERRLLAFKRSWPDATARLDVGDRVRHHDAVRVLDVLHRVGFETIQLAGISAATSRDVSALTRTLPLAATTSSRR